MSETLVQFQTLVAAADGTVYRARACASPMEGGTWQGWIEFDPVRGGETIRSPRETTQPNRRDTEYWASGLTAVYLEGALSRALNPLIVAVPPAPPTPRFEGPAQSVKTEVREPVVQSVLDPFSVYEKGETLLRKQLNALSAWHLVNIILDYELADSGRNTLERLPATALIDMIVEAVQSADRPVQSHRRR